MSNVHTKMPTSYDNAMSMLGGREFRTIAHNTTLRTYIEATGRVCDVVYHSTVIARFYANGQLSINSGGYHTSTTKDRLNGILRPRGYSVFQKDFVWYIRAIDTGEVTDYDDWTLFN